MNIVLRIDFHKNIKKKLDDRPLMPTHAKNNVFCTIKSTNIEIPTINKYFQSEKSWVPHHILNA